MQSMGIEMSKRERLAELNPDALLLEPEYLDEALVGIAFVNGEYVALYSEEKLIQVFMREEGLDEDDAWDNYYYNVLGSCGGENHPVFLEGEFDGD
jgi:hypothetical protein